MPIYFYNSAHIEFQNILFFENPANVITSIRNYENGEKIEIQEYKQTSELYNLIQESKLLYRFRTGNNARNNYKFSLSLCSNEHLEILILYDDGFHYVEHNGMIYCFKNDALYSYLNKHF